MRFLGAPGWIGSPGFRSTAQAIHDSGVDALVIGNGGIGIRLGYERNGVRGPWLIAAIAHRLERELDEISSSDIDWTDAPEPLPCRTAPP